MPRHDPETLLDARYSSPDAAAVQWPEAEKRLAEAELYWLTTVRADGRPHMTPLLGVWADGAMYFTTGADEQKTRNLAGNARCVLAAGNDRWTEGLSLTVEGTAVRVRDEDRLRRLAAAWLAKYGEDWQFGVVDGDFDNPQGGRSQVYEVAPVTAHGFAKGVFGQTRWTF